MLRDSELGDQYELILTDPAQEDLFVIAAYTSQNWGAAQARKYNDDFYQTFLNILHSPDIGRARFGVPEKIKGIQSGRHVIFYRIDDQRIFILRILHENMDYGRHFH